MRLILTPRAKSIELANPRRRLRICLAAFLALLGVVLLRAGQIEFTYGEGFRAEAARPLVRRRPLPGVRGRILSRDGSVLACDRRVSALAVHYRYLEEPCNPTWLRRTARARLISSERSQPTRVSAEEARVLAERTDLAARIGQMCHLGPGEWARRAGRIQARVERITESVNRRAQAGRRAEDQSPTADGLLSRLWEAMKSSSESPRGRITVAEEREYHVMIDELPLALVAEVEASPERYPGVKIVEQWRRDYPRAALAAHVVGHLGPPEPNVSQDRPDELCGRAGVERQCETLLRGRSGLAVELTDHAGGILKSFHEQEPVVGRDVVLTLDARLQQAAETLLDQAIRRRQTAAASAGPGGGAIVVLDVQSGAVLAAASAPRFEPGWFAGASTAAAGALTDPARPLFDRAAAMAIAPGSVFKVVTSIALLESGLDPRALHFCRGYLDDPGRWRCAVYQRRGEGHGDVGLRDALAQSCNVYFFHHARRMGPEPLVDWARRLGFGRATGLDLPGEASGTLPTPENIETLERHPWRTADTLETAIGQGSLTATPMHVARLMAAVANGGRLVTPHLVMGLGLTENAAADDPAADALRVPPPAPIAGLTTSTLAALADALEAAVADPRGTAHATVWQPGIAIAAKTGTAQTGPGRPDHAWLAGYAPAERPRVAFVVVLEQAGDAGFAAGPVVRRLVKQMKLIGLL